MQLSTMRSEGRVIFNETDPNNSHFSEVKLTEWANECTRFILTRLGVIPIKERDYTSASTITLNLRFLTIDSAFIKMQPENKFTELKIIDLDFLSKIDSQWLEADTGKPEYFVRVDTFTARLYPAPNSENTGQTVRTYGMEFPSDMSADTDTPTLPLNLHDLYPHYIAYKAYSALQQKDQSANELIFVNSLLKAQQSISTKFSDGRNQWLYESSEG